MKAIEIEQKIDSGLTLYIRTALRSTVVNKRTLERWRNAGNVMFRDGDNNGERGFYIASGKSFVFVSPFGCKVTFEQTKKQ